MTSRELVRRSLEFSGPARVPRDLWWLPWAEQHHPQAMARLRADYPSDIVQAPAICPAVPSVVGDPYAVGLFVDEWGCRFENVQRGVIGEVKQPLVRDWADAGSVVAFPRQWLDFDREEVSRFCGATDKWVNAPAVPRPFERLQFLRGSENLYLDLAMGDPGLFAFIDRLHGFYLELLEAWARTDVDGLMIMDDWGAQQALLIRPRMWRQVFKPLYRDYARLAHAHGKKLFLHSDGYILDIYPDLIEIGVDALNSQIFCMGIEALAQFRGRITCWGEIDRQHLLPHGTTAEIRAAVRHVHELLYGNGGLIAQCEFGLMADPQNVYEVFAEWAELVH